MNNDPEIPEIPKRTIQIVSRTVLIGFDDQQYRQLLYLSASAKFSSLRRRFLHLRPIGTVVQDPGAWWRYAARVVLKERGISARGIHGEEEYQSHVAAAKKRYTDSWFRKKILDKMLHDQQLSASRASKGLFAAIGRGIFGTSPHASDGVTSKLLEDVNQVVDSIEQDVQLRYEDIVLFRSLATHRLLARMQMQEREKAKRRASRSKGGRHAKEGRGRSSAESASEDNADEDDYADDASTESTTKQPSSQQKSGTGSSALYRWTAGWIWGKKDSSEAQDTEAGTWDETRADLEQLFKDALPAPEAIPDTSTPSKQKLKRSAAASNDNEVVILHVFVEHAQLQLLNVPTKRASGSIPASARHTLRTVHAAQPVSFLSLQFSEFSLEQRAESAGVLRSSTRVSLKALSATDLTSDSELFSHIFLSQSQAALAQQQIEWVRIAV